MRGFACRQHIIRGGVLFVFHPKNGVDMNAHVLGFPRMGVNRELKWALEKFWKEDCTESELVSVAENLKKRHWKIQALAGMDLISVGDFSFYDHVLDTIAMLGAVPERFQWDGKPVDFKTYFRMARGDAETGVPAMEMTKWFDSNYHYIVPELGPDTPFKNNGCPLLDDVQAVRKLGYAPKPVLVGPLTFLLLAKEIGGCNRWDHLERMTTAYCGIITELAKHCEWIQIDEPVLCTDLPVEAVQAFPFAYSKLKAAAGSTQLLLTTYFDELKENLDLALSLPVDGIHIDLVRGAGQFKDVLTRLPAQKKLSIGLVDGRNVWKTDLDAAIDRLNTACEKLGADRVLIASSCSLLHSPIDISVEKDLDPELKQWMAFAMQKCEEIAALKTALVSDTVPPLFDENRTALQARKTSSKVVDPQVRERASSISVDMFKRSSSFEERSLIQKKELNLPIFPTTTIGSYPQTPEIRKTRLAYKKNELSKDQYQKEMQKQISEVVQRQEELGLDVLVHGEPERNDMVEYFGGQLKGFCFTSNGWVQSYGSRCVKPPIIYGDISRPAPMTVDWAVYAQSLTKKPMKGMLTGPVTILCWSFVRDDLHRSEVCRQIGLAVRDEVIDLETAGIRIIQIDEAALREGMPIRKDQRDEYLRWAVDCFRLSAGGVKDSTQIHSHMCYSEFNTIVRWIAEMDADVISIEASRSGMDLLEAFDAYQFPSDIGPGVYDIHSPRVPGADEIYWLLQKALKVIPAERLWVNPDCGLKTRAWPETTASLRNMVMATNRLRKEYDQ